MSESLYSSLLLVSFALSINNKDQYSPYLKEAENADTLSK